MSPLSPPVQAILELFQGPLAELRFADVNAAVLANSASAVEAAALAVTEQEAQLAELRQTLTDRQDALTALAQRALAYARVYAEQDEALTEQLSRITLSRPSKPRKPSAKAAGAEAPAASSASALGNPSAEPSAVRTETSASEEPTIAEAARVFVAEETADPNAEAPSFDAPDPDAQPARKGKRRSSSARDEAQSRPG